MHDQLATERNRCCDAPDTLSVIAEITDFCYNVASSSANDVPLANASFLSKCSWQGLRLVHDPVRLRVLREPPEIDVTTLNREVLD